MTTVTISVADRTAFKTRALAAFRGEAQGAHISFADPETAWRVLTAKRWSILRAMVGKDAMSIREVARTVARDVKAVHTDVRALLAAGILRKTEKGVVFPFDTVHVDFMLTAA